MRSRSLALVALFALATPGCTKIAGTSIGEVAEIFTMGSAKKLNEPLRTPRGEDRVLIFALDGVGGEVLSTALREGRMPNLSRLLGPAAGPGLFQHAYLDDDVLTVLPSATIPAWTSTFTGATPAHTGVPGNEWFVREEMTFYAPVPVTITNRTHAAKIFTDDLMSELVRQPTLYEQLPVMRMHVSTHPVFRGVDLVTVPDLARFGDLMGAILGETLTGSVKRSSRVARETDETSVGSLLDVLGDVGLADVQTVYFNGIDLLTHYAERPAEEQRAYLEAVTDTLIGRVLDRYREQGVLDRTYVVLTADHGHTAVLADDRHSLYTDGEDEPTALIRQAGFRLRQNSLTADREDYQAAIAFQGFMAYLYLADRSSCPAEGQRCDWSRPPRLEEDVLPMVRALYEANRDGTRVPALLGTLDMILVRTGAGVRAFDGERLVPIADYLRRNPNPQLVRFEERIMGLTAGPYGHYAGDIILVARTGAHRPIEERFYFGAVQTSEHGSPHAGDSYVPLLVAHPALAGTAVRDRVRTVVGDNPTQVDFARLIRELAK